MLPKVYVTRHLPAAAWQELSAACSVEIWDRDSPPSYETLLEAVRDREGLLCLLTDRIDASLMDAAPRLRVISQCAVGYDNVDVAAASARGIPYTTQVDSASAKTVPPWVLIARAPSSPSRPIPVNTTPMARGPKTAASDRNNSSTEGRTP